MQKITQKSGISLIFAIIVVTALMITSVGLNEIIIRNLNRVSDMESTLQAQAAAETGFERALYYITENCDAGCDSTVTDETILDPETLEVVATYSYEIQGKSSTNPDDAMYYVPVPGTGNAGTECDRDNPSAPDSDDGCNWNKIYYGQTVEIPLYTNTINQFPGNELYIKVRTPLCEDGDTDCDTTSDRKLIACLDDTVTETLNDCDFDDDPVVMTWQIWGERDSGSDYVEGWEEISRFGNKRNETKDSEIYTTLINSNLSSSYEVLNDEQYGSPDEDTATIDDILSDPTDPLTTPVLKLSFVQTIANDDGPIQYLEYQVKTDTQISNNISFIDVIGYVVSKGETFFWTKEGSFDPYSNSTVNFVFQN